MTDLHPIFIHAWWRSSSTYVWSKLRRDESLRCYYEPLNERIAALKPADTEASPKAGMSRMLRHPVQTGSYFAEYRDLLASRSLRYSADLAYARYLLGPDQSDSGLHAYLDGLIYAASRAGRTAVLCFCRSQMRSAWMKRNFGGLHVAQIRNPVDQWASFQVNPYFVRKMVTVALGLRASHPGAFAHIERFERQAQVLANQDPLQRGTPATIALDPRDALGLFLVIWMASTLQAVACCDYLLDVDRLSTDGDYRDESSRWFRSSGCTVDFADCATPAAGETQSSPDAFARAVEEATAAIRSAASSLVIASPETVAERLAVLSPPSGRILGLALG